MGLDIPNISMDKVTPFSFKVNDEALGHLISAKLACDVLICQ